MRRLYILVTFMMFLAAPSAFSKAVENYDQAIKEAKLNQKEILIFFTAKWCGPCQKMKKEVLPIPEVSQLLDRDYIFLYCDVDKSEGRELKVRYNVGPIPTFVLINHKEEIKARKTGSMDKQTFLSFLNDNVESKPKEKAVKPAPSNSKYLYIYKGNDNSSNKKVDEILSDPLIKKRVDNHFVVNKIDAYRFYSPHLYTKYLEGKTPILIVCDKYKRPLNRLAGSIDKSKLVRLLETDKQHLDFTQYSDIVLLKRKTKFDTAIDKLWNSQWRPGVNIGINYLNLGNHESTIYSDYKVGYEVGLIADYTPHKLKKKFVFQSGLFFSSKGGKDKNSSKNIRINYIEVPFRFNYKVFNHKIFGCPQPVRLSLSPYAAYGISGKDLQTKTRLEFGKGANDFKRWDYGVKTGLNIAGGTFEFFAGYQFGLNRIHNNPANKYYNRGFFFTTTMVFGK